MPLYEYKCADCSHADDEYQNMREPPLSYCPRCSGSQYERQISRPSGAMIREYDRPIEMHSIAPVTASEVQAFKRRNPGVEFSRDGAPLARTRQEKLRILRNEGFVEKR